MRYLLMIYSPESHYATMSDADMGELMAAYGGFSEEIGAAGAMQGAERLKPTASATTVRIRDGKATATDGPFAETKEQLGGYYLLDCKDLDEATEWAAKIPSARFGSVEVRPVILFD